ncbi:hypothetical protein GQ54DRAFT_307622 [Martensiomyces pterosporus]|nr:hypothetical protein GQ54DRAFT_307622 [Martensiomyces pterosporus]
MGLKTLSGLSPSIAWPIINIIVSVLWIVAAILYFVNGYFQAVMLGIFLLVIGGTSIALEFWRPEVFVTHCFFLWNFMGRGIFFLLMGCIVLGHKVFTYVATGFTWFFGVVYIALWFSSLKLYPVQDARMREAELQNDIAAAY